MAIALHIALRRHDEAVLVSGTGRVRTERARRTEFVTVSFA
jgi:hypothetical protein